MKTIFYHDKLKTNDACTPVGVVKSYQPEQLDYKDWGKNLLQQRKWVKPVQPKKMKIA